MVFLLCVIQSVQVCAVPLKDMILDAKCHHTQNLKKKKRYRIAIWVGELIWDENVFLKNKVYM